MLLRNKITVLNMKVGIVVFSCLLKVGQNLITINKRLQTRTLHVVNKLYE